MVGSFSLFLFIYLFIYLFIFLPKISFTDTEVEQQKKEGNLPLPTTPTCWWKLRNLLCGLNLICLPPIFSCSACNCQTVIMLIAFFVVAVFELSLIFKLQSGLRRNWSSMKYHDSITNTATNLANRSPLFYWSFIININDFQRIVKFHFARPSSCYSDNFYIYRGTPYITVCLPSNPCW